MGAEEKKTTDRDNLSTESWPEIIRDHQRYIYNLAYNLCHNRDDADDLSQEDEKIIASHLVQCDFCEREWRKFTRAVCVIKAVKEMDPPRILL